MQEEWLEMKKATRFLGVSRQFLYEHRDDGCGPPFHRRGRRIIFSKKELEDWIDKNRCGIQKK